MIHMIQIIFLLVIIGLLLVPYVKVGQQDRKRRRVQKRQQVRDNRG